MAIWLYEPETSNPTLCIAEHFGIELSVAYSYADYILRVFQNKPSPIWHDIAIKHLDSDDNQRKINEFKVSLLHALAKHRNVSPQSYYTFVLTDEINLSTVSVDI